LELEEEVSQNKDAEEGEERRGEMNRHRDDSKV